MLVVTHEMGFAREVANRVVFMDAGQIIESNTPAEFFANPQHARSKLFLSQILRHYTPRGSLFVAACESTRMLMLTSRTQTGNTTRLQSK